MIQEPFIQRAVLRHNGINKSFGTAKLFISANWNKELLIGNNYFGLKKGDTVYLRCKDKRLKFNNLKITFTYPTTPKVGSGGVHLYTFDLALPRIFYSKHAYIELSNKPFPGETTEKVTYILPDGQQIKADPLKPITWPDEVSQIPPVLKTPEEKKDEATKAEASKPEAPKQAITNPVHTQIEKEKNIAGPSSQSKTKEGLTTLVKAVLFVVIAAIALKLFKVI